MAIKASSSITLSSVVDVKAVYRYYLLQSSTLAKPSKPTSYPPPTAWNDSEPAYVNGSTYSLYTVDVTVFSDDTWAYSEVSLSTAYEAAKSAYNKAVNAQNGVDALTTRVTTAETSISKNTDEIALRATKTEVTTAINDIDNQISAVAEEINQTILDQRTEIVETSRDITLSALEDYVTKSEHSEFESYARSEFSVMGNSMDMRFEEVSQAITNVDGDIQTEIAERSKHISFASDNAICIGGTVSGIVLTVDNDNGIIFSKIVSKSGVESSTASVTLSKVLYQLGTSKTAVPTGTWVNTMPESIPVDQYLWIRKLVTYSDGTMSITESVAFGSWDGNDFYTGNIVVRVTERAQFGNLAFVPNEDGSLSFLKVGG